MRSLCPILAALTLAATGAAPAPTPTPIRQQTFYSISTGQLLGPWPSPSAYPLPWLWGYPVICRAPAYVRSNGRCRRVRPMPSKRPPR
jgi:hypothetical protein